jgi:hypothetical protein
MITLKLSKLQHSPAFLVFGTTAFFNPFSSVLCPRLLLISRCLDGFFTDLCDGRNWDHDATEARVQRPLILTIKVLKRRNVVRTVGGSTDFFHLVAYNGTGAPVRFGFQLVQRKLCHHHSVWYA